MREDGDRLWFACTPRQLAEWYNAEHTLDELLPDESNGYGLASWRSERTASVGKREYQWTDFVVGACQGDGTHDGDDALELAARLNGEMEGKQRVYDWIVATQGGGRGVS